MAESVEQEFYVSEIANPIASDKLNKKVLRTTKKLMSKKKLKRGVKEVVKSIRKGATGVVILAADVSPIDVISHIPILCENKGIPYVYVRSRLELGVAAQTKKPTSVILMQDPTEDKKLSAKFNSLKQKISKLNPFV